MRRTIVYKKNKTKLTLVGMVLGLKIIVLICVVYSTSVREKKTELCVRRRKEETKFCGSASKLLCSRVCVIVYMNLI